MIERTIGFVCVPVSEDSPRIVEKLKNYRSTFFDNTAYYISHPLNDFDYHIVMVFEIIPDEINRLIKYVKEIVQSFWIQFECNTAIFVRAFENGELVYSMSGGIERGKDLDDVVRDSHEGLDEACRNRETDYLEFRNDDDQVYVRRFMDDKTIEIMNGIVELDTRDKKNHFLFSVNKR